MRKFGPASANSRLKRPFAIMAGGPLGSPHGVTVRSTCYCVVEDQDDVLPLSNPSLKIVFVFPSRKT